MSVEVKDLSKLDTNQLRQLWRSCQGGEREMPSHFDVFRAENGNCEQPVSKVAEQEALLVASHPGADGAVLRLKKKYEKIHGD